MNTTFSLRQISINQVAQGNGNLWRNVEKSNKITYVYRYFYSNPCTVCCDVPDCAIGIIPGVLTVFLPLVKQCLPCKARSLQVKRKVLLGIVLNKGLADSHRLFINHQITYLKIPPASSEGTV
jgi:hypothetical protein